MPMKKVPSLLTVASRQDIEREPRLAFLASIIESSNDAITSANMDAIITSWNAAAERIYGYSAEEMIGQPVSLLIPPENSHEDVDILRKIRGGYKIEPYETLQIRKDGSTFPVSLTLSPIYDESGSVIGRSAIARDLTQEKEASQNARDMALLIESSNDAIVSSSMEGIITSWNAAAERMFGYCAEEMIGKSITPIIPPENTHEDADILSKIRDGYKIESYETLRIRKDGSTIPISLTISHIYDESGAPIGISGIARDITKEKEASQNARKLASIIESSNDAIMSASLEGIIDSWNPAAEGMYGYLAKEIIGQSFSCLDASENVAAALEIIKKIRNDRKVESYETVQIRKDGSTFPALMTISPIRNENGLVIGASSIARDLTEEQLASQFSRDLLDSALDAMVIVDKTGTIVIVNPQTEKLFGYQRDEMLGQLVELLIPSRFHAEHSSQRDRHFANPRAKSMGERKVELFGRGKDGREFPVEISLAPMKTARGPLVTATIRDVTEQQQASQNTRNIASIIESSNDAITSESLEGIFISWNPAAERLYGYLAEEVIGQSNSRLIPPESTNEAADNRSKIRAGYKIEPYETLGIRKDGSTISISLTLSPIYDGNGVVIGTSGISRDITAEKEASQNARNMAFIIQSSNDAITSFDIDRTFTSWNAAAERMFGYLAEEMIGQSILLLIPPENVHEETDNRSKIKDGYKIEPYETTRIRKDGSSIPISLTISPIYDGNGAIIGSSGIARDITAEKAMIRQLKAMNELRNEFVTTVAHDLRAPMTSISGFAHLLIDEWDATDDGKKIEYLQIIARNTDTLAQFVEDVLQVARIEAGEYTYHIGSFDAPALAQRALAEAIGPNIDWRFKLTAPDDLPLVCGDEERVWQVLTNLLSNAVKFSPAPEPIVVELSSIGDFVQVAVIDRGIGIAKEDLPKLFRKSGRLVKSGSPITPGNGLGLFICKTLVEAQGGRIWCESAPGAGSTFFFTIPVAR